MTLSAAALTAINNAAAAASATALASGTVEILDGSGNVLASAGLGAPTSSGATTTMGGFPKTVTASGSGTAATARYRTSAAADWKTGMPCGTSGTQVVLSSLSITAGQSVLITSATLAHSATSA
jgi:hypothetical protein